MPLLTAKSLQLAYGTQPLLDKADIAIEPQERIALIGRNGEGKSSFLKIIGGLMPPDDGEIAREQGLHAQYVTQEPQFDSTQTVQQAIAQTIHQAIEQGRSSEDVWTIEARAHSLVSKLGLLLDQTVGRLSGGEIKRMQLLVALAFNPQLLLLDEPTNHMDLDGIAWLEQTLLSFRGAVMLVSHDRMFLDRVCTRIVELDRGRLTSFPGSYAKYQEIKARILSDEAVVNAKFDKFLAQEEVWIRKGVEARRTRNEGRVRRLLDLRRTREARRERKGDVKLTIAEGERTGKLVAELRAISYDIGERTIIKPFSAVISRGDKLGILGRNGVGKTTLVKLVLGELRATGGELYRPAYTENALRVAYFDQFREALDDEAALADVISPGSDYVEIGGVKKHVITYLEDFLFPPQRARAKVKALSGGERARLLLARLFARPANVLVLDEPTNDLDIETIELLEEMLADYSGTVIVISHDRALINNVCTSVFAFDTDGEVREYPGGYDDWVAQRPTLEEKAVTAKADEVKPAQAKAKEKKLGLTFTEVKELEKLPAQIEKLEAQVAQAQAALQDPALYTDPSKQGNLKAMNDAMQQLEAQLAKTYERWEELESKREGAA